jgi:hypothetical protein
MLTLLRLLWDLCLFRRGPQDLPYSPALARALLLVQAGAGLLYLRVVGAGEHGLSQLALSLTMAVVMPWALLRARDRQARYAQTLSALVGTWIFATLAYLPIAAVAADLPLPEPGVPPTRAQAAVAWATLVLAAWKLAINGQIWRHALDFPLFGGIAAALGVFVLELGLLRLVLAS